ncbi:hypothetical protein QZH41_020428 [Actinostola sp. cb2023]|nr:hypothetical protein QZH41_020428 [Actinostola sp. cb2023]
MTLARGEREWALLISEYNICKKKLESKRQALKILMGDLESCQRERDIYKNKIKQMQQEIENYKKKELENEHKELRGRKSPTSPSVRSPEHIRPKRERKFSGQSIWEQELQSVRDRKNKTLSQLLCEAREENKALKNDFMDLRVLYREAQEDIILLRENVARQRTHDRGTGKMEDLEARQDLIQHLEKNQEKVEDLEREVEATSDEKSEIIIERDHYRDKVERLNTQLNFILGADDRRLVDIDAILMENRYQKEQIKQLKEVNRIGNASLARQKAALEKKKARLAKASYAGTGAKQGTTKQSHLQKSLPHLISEISSSFGSGVSSSTISDLQSLANSLSESLSEKDIALLHQRNTNKILGNRVSELEKKLKTLEVSGLWSLEGHRGYGSEDMLQLYLEKVKRSPHSSNTDTTIQASDENGETEVVSAESSPDLDNGDSVFFVRDACEVPNADEQLIDVHSTGSTPTISEEGDDAKHCENNNGSSNNDLTSYGVSACRVEKSIEGDSLPDGDLPSHGDSLPDRDSPSHGDSPPDRDSPLYGDSPPDRDSPSHGDSPPDRDSPLYGNSFEKESNSEDSEVKGHSPANEDSLNNSYICHKGHSSHKSSERSPLNTPGNLNSKYGSLGKESHQINIVDAEGVDDDTRQDNQYRDGEKKIQFVKDCQESFDDSKLNKLLKESDTDQPHRSSLEDLQEQAILDDMSHCS